MKKIAICMLSAALALCGAAATAEKETLNFKEDDHEVIVTAEVIGRGEYGETAFDIRVTMDGEEIQNLNFTAENTNEGEQEVYPCDVNMDGYADLALLNSMGASDGFASYYVYDPAAGTFVHHKELERLSFYRAQFYPEKRQHDRQVPRNHAGIHKFLQYLCRVSCCTSDTKNTVSIDQ